MKTIMEGSFTQGGLAYFSESDAAKGPLKWSQCRARFLVAELDWVWVVLVFQWHPEHRGR